MLTFMPISLYQPGTLAGLIRRSYAGLITQSPEYWEPEAPKWDDFDRQAFAHANTVGKCIFVSCLGDQPVGLASYDPRPGPEYGLVGQNCILPEYQGRGFGRLQVLEILRRFEEMKFRAARVTTSEHPFFLPAMKMYVALGFREIRRFPGGPDQQFELVEFERELSLWRS
jgi:GNAT superfamily N-acetyltransferase